MSQGKLRPQSEKRIPPPPVPPPPCLYALPTASVLPHDLYKQLPSPSTGCLFRPRRCSRSSNKMIFPLFETIFFRDPLRDLVLI